MAVESGRRIGADLVERMLAPVGWTQQGIARLLGWFNQERWTNLLTILALVLCNLVILSFLLQGQDNRAIAFVILALVAPLAFLIPELSIVVFISAGAGLFVNAMYFAVGSGFGTGERTLILTFLGILSARALYEYVRTPASQRPRLFSFFTLILLLFWIYYMMHVLYIYIFMYNEPPPDAQIDAVLGIHRTPLFRYFDYHMIWIGIFPLIILMRDYQRAKRVFTLLAIVMVLGMVTIIWDYLAPLPIFFKILFQLRAAGADEEGYRIRDPASLYMLLVGFFCALYALGYARGWLNAVMLGYIALGLMAILITKNRALWAGIALFLPFVLLWKPPSALLKQVQMLVIAGLVLLSFLLHPRIAESANRVAYEAMQRWSRNYAFGGDPRLDPSYQDRLRELEAFQRHWDRLPLSQKWFGAGLEATYGYYIPLSRYGYRNPRFERLFVEKSYIHFSWVARLHHLGYVGVTLLALTLATFLIRALLIFLSTKDIFARILIMGIAGSTVGMITYDILHQTLDSGAAVPVVMLWSMVELVAHWQRTAQIDVNEEIAS